MSEKMRVLLFGANGQVGFECAQLFSEAGFDLVPLTRQEVDLSDLGQVYDAVMVYQPELVINAAAYTAVDKAESEPELAAQINHYAVKAMAEACHRLDIPLLHISTDYVFDGEKKGGDLETDPVNPQSVYGQTKLDGELAIQSVHAKHIILRTSWVFGRHGNNFVKTMVRLGLERNELSVVSDQLGCPTFAGDIAAVISSFIEGYSQEGILPWGVYHCSDLGKCSWYDFALAVFGAAVKSELLMRSPLLISITTDEYPTPAARPLNSELNCNKLQAFTERPMPHWREGLVRVCNQLASFNKTTD